MESSSSEDDIVVLSLLKKRKRKEILGPSNPRYREDGEFPFLIKDQRDYHGRFKVYFRMSVAQFNALLAILEPRIKKKTTHFCELGVQGSLQCFVLRDEVDELDNSGFWRSLVRWLWIVKTPLKMCATDAKNAENLTLSKKNLWRTKVLEAVCKHDWHSVRSYLFFQCAKISDSVCNYMSWYLGLCSAGQMAKVQKGDDLDVRDPEWFSEPFSSLWINTVLEGWAGGAPIIRSADRTILCSLLIPDFVAEPNQTVIEVHKTDSMMAE